jgi:cytidine deaminase
VNDALRSKEKRESPRTAGESATTSESGHRQLIAAAGAAAIAFRASEHCEAGDVGAALLTDDGRMFSGCSVDCKCGIGFCAEHSAVAEMLKARTTRVRAVVAVNGNGTILPPCGRCRELLYQVDPANLDTDVILAADRAVKLRELLPYPWQPTHKPG